MCHKLLLEDPLLWRSIQVGAHNGPRQIVALQCSYLELVFDHLTFFILQLKKGNTDQKVLWAKGKHQADQLESSQELTGENTMSASNRSLWRCLLFCWSLHVSHRPGEASHLGSWLKHGHVSVIQVVCDLNPTAKHDREHRRMWGSKDWP